MLGNKKFIFSLFKPYITELKGDNRIAYLRFRGVACSVISIGVLEYIEDLD